jgi:hypothetical protein
MLCYVKWRIGSSFSSIPLISSSSPFCGYTFTPNDTGQTIKTNFPFPIIALISFKTFNLSDKF